jgi:hypothetical protein
MDATQGQSKIKNVIDEQTAIVEFERFLEEFELDFDVEKMDEDDLKGFTEQKSKFVKAVMRGRLKLNDDNNAVYKTTDGLELTFHEPTGAAFSSTDAAKVRENIKKKNILLGSITKTAPQTFAKMKQRDLKICDAILMLFLV